MFPLNLVYIYPPNQILIPEFFFIESPSVAEVGEHRPLAFEVLYYLIMNFLIKFDVRYFR